MKIDILTLFPEMFTGVFDESIVKIAKKKQLVALQVHNLRKWTFDRHGTADDKPYGGGPGMIMKVEPVDLAINELKNTMDNDKKILVILLTPQGIQLKQEISKKLADCCHLVLICGHYEGVDERIRSLVDMEISIGDYVLTCGEIPAMVLCDSIIRLIPGVLGDKECLIEESFEQGMLEYPQYTRPYTYKGMPVPSVLLNGDPKKITKWKAEQALTRTRLRRPDMLINKYTEETADRN